MVEKELIRYIRGEEMSNQEIDAVLVWIESSEENQKKYNELKQLWVISGLTITPGYSQKKFFAESFVEKGRRKLFISEWSKYAAVFILAFITGLFTWQYVFSLQQGNYAEAYNEIVVPKGQKSVVSLYDGTEVWLNSGTRFRYPAVFNSSCRDVFLDGEAFFSVTKSKERPFFVHAGAVRVKVLGTKFNVYAYKDDAVVSTTLEEGSVEISTEGSRENQKLAPGQQMNYLKSSGKFELKNVETDLFTSWKENTLRFDNSELAEILKKMERWYDVKMNIEEGLELKERFTISIKTESLKEMMDVLSIAADINYKIETDAVTIYKK